MTREEAIKVASEMHGWLQTDREREALETLIPELAESKEEKIRKEMLAFFKNFYETGTWNAIPDSKEWIAYLERQKDASKAIEAVERIDKYIDWHVANAHDMKDSDPEKKYYRGWDDALGKMAGILQDVYSNEHPKEQGLTAKINGEPIPTENYSVNIPLTEWGEEDERMLSRCIKSVECSKQFADSETYKAAKDVEMNWLKFLPERFNLQPKQEWGEEDERNIRNLESILYYDKKLPEETRVELGNFLKSLRPAWKPNEAQMRAIRNFPTGLFIGNGDYAALLSLIEDLGKLYYKRME